MYIHKLETIFSIDSRFRNKTDYPNAYKVQIFLEKEFGFLDLLELLHIHIPYVSQVTGMNEKLAPSTTPVPYLFIKIKIESFPENILNTIITPISDTTIDSTISIFAKIGLTVRNDSVKVYNKIIYGKKNFNDTLSIVKAASAIDIHILGMDGTILSSEGHSPDFEANTSNNWNITLQFTEKIQLLKKLNVNSVRSIHADPRA